MKVLRVQWNRRVECVYCGCSMEVEESDLHAVSYRTRHGRQKTDYYITCSILGCKKDTIINDLPTSIKHTLSKMSKDLLTDVL